MNKRTVKYTNEPIGKVKTISDFLPHPDELVKKVSHARTYNDSHIKLIKKFKSSSIRG